MAADQFLEVTLSGDQNLLRNFDQFPAVVQSLLMEKSKYWGQQLKDEIVENIRERLQEKTGKLSRSVEFEVNKVGNSLMTKVVVRHPAALALEKGAQIPPHIILPKNAKILRFWNVYGQKMYALRVFHPGAVIKGYYFVKDARKIVAPLMMRDLKKAIVDGIRRSMRGQS